MSSFTFNLNGKDFTVRGEGITEAQAREIFQQQNAAGSLVGLKSGQTLNAATQALGGLDSARSQVSEALGSGLSLDAGGLGLDSAKDLLDSAAGAVIPDAINVADLALQAPALTNIDQASANQVRGALSGAAKLADQATDAFTDLGGVGTYGFDAGQLETEGYIKPGTVDTYLSNGTNSLTNVLKSPTVWVGKNNINNVNDFLANPALQTFTQTSLMKAGVAALKTNGVGTQALSGAALMGTALVAANGVRDTLDWIKGRLPTAQASDLAETFRQGEFSANFAETKISDAMSQLYPALPAVNTVDRATLNAATGRVLGNEKIPDLNYSISALPSASELNNQLSEINAEFRELEQDAGILIGRIARTQIPEFINEQYDNLIAGGRLLGLLDVIKGRLLSLKRQAEANDPPDTGVVSAIDRIQIDALISQLENVLDKLEQDVTVASQA